MATSQPVTGPMDAYEVTADEWRRPPGPAPTVERPDASALADLTKVDDRLSADALIDSHLPLAEFIATLAEEATERRLERSRIFGVRVDQPPLVVGVTGAVAAGKTVTANVLRSILAASGERTVEVVATDGFLLPNRELEARGLMERKGFPESYDHAGLIGFLTAVKAGRVGVSAPVYDHVLYDVTPDRRQVLDRPEILILEGINVLQLSPPSDGDGRLLVSDFLDFSIYVDGDEPDIRAWFLRRLQDLRARSTGDATSFYAGFASLSDADFLAMGEAVWESVNLPNLEQHIAPTRPRADLVVEKAADHSVRRVLIRPR